MLPQTTMHFTSLITTTLFFSATVLATLDKPLPTSAPFAIITLYPAAECTSTSSPVVEPRTEYLESNKCVALKGKGLDVLEHAEGVKYNARE
jgi:hypothetical protein